MKNGRAERHAAIAAAIGVGALIVSLATHLLGFLSMAALPGLEPPTLGTGQRSGELAFYEFEVEDSSEPEESEAEAPDPEAHAEPIESETEARVPIPDEPEERVVVPPPPAVEAEQRTPPPPPDPMNRQAVQQRSDNPELQPDNPRFIAEENRVVEEETQAQIRSHQEDAEETSPGEEQTPTDYEEEGNANHEEVEDNREREGSDVRTATEVEARAERPERASEEPPPNVPARGDTGREGQARGDEAGATEQGGETSAFEVTDREAALAMLVPSGAEGTGGGTEGGDRREGAGRGTAGEGERAGRSGERRGDSGRGRGTGETGPDLRVSWNNFEQAVGREQLDLERERWVQERQSRIRGSNRQRDWRRFRAAIENYVPNVRPGNQTALNAAASPYAGYIAAVHRRIHRQYADRFISGLPAGGLSPFADRSLMTKLEIIVNRDGTVHRVGVVRTSGYLMFDHGAFSSVMRAQPFPEAPSQILSGDGRVYLHWGFYRNERQCGTFNAEPFILANPPGTPRRGQELLRDGSPDGPAEGVLVPEDAEPSWGTETAPSPTAPAPDAPEQRKTG